MIDLRIGDSDEIHSFYRSAFGDLGQQNCLMLVRKWIKFIEPRKPALYPYKGNKRWVPELTKPPWWPDEVVHAAPDNLQREERVTLLVHILCEVVKADDLKKVADDVKQKFKSQKRKVLDEILDLRMLQERFGKSRISNLDPHSDITTYKCLDPQTIVHVNHFDRSSQRSESLVHKPSMPLSNSIGMGSDRCKVHPTLSASKAQPRQDTPFYSTSGGYADNSSSGSVPNIPATPAMARPQSQTPICTPLLTLPSQNDIFGSADCNTSTSQALLQPPAIPTSASLLPYVEWYLAWLC